MKTFIITVSKTFLASHPKAGQKTFFKKKILTGQKIHTMRGNYPYWNKIAKQVNKGEAILSLREWTGKPYKSKQREIKKYKKIGIQKVKKKNQVFLVDNKQLFMSIDKFAYNDGLNTIDLYNWFSVKNFAGAIIHFTNFRY